MRTSPVFILFDVTALAVRASRKGMGSSAVYHAQQKQRQQTEKHLKQVALFAVTGHTVPYLRGAPKWVVERRFRLIVFTCISVGSAPWGFKSARDFTKRYLEARCRLSRYWLPRKNPRQYRPGNARPAALERVRHRLPKGKWPARVRRM